VNFSFKCCFFERIWILVRACRVTDARSYCTPGKNADYIGHWFAADFVPMSPSPLWHFHTTISCVLRLCTLSLSRHLFTSYLSTIKNITVELHLSGLIGTGGCPDNENSSQSNMTFLWQKSSHFLIYFSEKIQYLIFFWRKIHFRYFLGGKIHFIDLFGGKNIPVLMKFCGLPFFSLRNKREKST